MTEEINYGPLAGLIGTWYGDKGVDIAPEPEETERNPYHETIIFTGAGDVDNAESETLVILHYHQIVTRKSTGLVFHNQCGYWTWKPGTDEILHTLTIPRGVCVVAAGSYSESDDKGLEINVSTEGDFPAVAESAFMNKNARTKSFSMYLQLHEGELVYRESTMLDIYGREFDHKDMNRLHKQA
ncbi:MAG: heme-binding beta-barrel domain-containing protein, partial [Nevskiales bacterium]